MSLKSYSEALHAFSATVSASTPAAMIAVPPVTSWRTRIYRLIMTLAGTAGTVQLQDTSAVNLTQPFQLGITGGVSLDVPFNLDPWWVTNQGVGVQAVITGAGTLGWDIWYTQGP